eukprot:8473146-Lingulodinium_polyedra.AAC.1
MEVSLVNGSFLSGTMNSALRMIARAVLPNRDAGRHGGPGPKQPEKVDRFYDGRRSKPEEA